MTGMTGNDYQQLAMRTNDGLCNNRLYKMCSEDDFNKTYAKEHIARADLILGMLGICGEAGEAIEIVKKAVFHGHELKVDQLKKELGDILWYVAMCCNAIGTDMETVMEINIAKLVERYPEGFSEQASQNRKEEA